MLLVSHICYLRLDLFLAPCHFRCPNLNFADPCSGRLDVFHLPCHSKCLKLNFGHTCSSRHKCRPFLWRPWCLKLNFSHTCISRLDLCRFPWHCRWISIWSVPAMEGWMYSVSHSILGSLSLIISTSAGLE